MSTQQINPEAATRREQARDDRGRFGPSAALETDVALVDLDRGGDPRGEDWHDPDTGGVPGEDERAERILDAVGRLEDEAGEGRWNNLQDETFRLQQGKKALAGVFRASHPHVKEIHLGGHDYELCVEKAVDHDGNEVDVRDGWPAGAGLDRVNEHTAQIVASPVRGSVEIIFGDRQGRGPGDRGRYVVDIDETLDDSDAPF